MQYRLNGSAIKGFEKGAVITRTEPIKLALIFITTLLLSRVTIMVGEGDIVGISPFGIAFLISIVLEKNQSKVLTASIGGLVGYFTINNMLKDGFVYALIILFMLGYSLLFDKLKKRISDKQMFAILFLSYLIYGLFISNYDMGVNITMAALNTLISVPIYYVIRYGIKCVGEYNTNYFFNVEELISIAFIICLMVAGIGSFSIVGISIRNILSLAIVISIAYVGGATNGATIGIAMGVVVGVTTGDMIGCIGLYGSVGLIAGLFKETGKVFSFISSILIFLIISFYSNGLNMQGISEILIGGMVFLIIPKKFLKMLEIEICADSKIEKINEEHLEQVKEEFSNKVQNFGLALGAISTSLNNMSDNDKLCYKNKSTGLIENLADRVCSVCSNCSRCWNREFNQTYTAFEVLLKEKEQGKHTFPSELEKKCIRKSDLIFNSEEIINILNGNEIIRRKLEEGRKIVANHINNISYNLDTMVTDFKRDITWCEELERVIRRELNKNSIAYKEVFCYTDKGGRANVKISMEKCSGCDYCAKNVLPVVNEIVGSPMSINNNGCRINPNNKDCYIVLEEMPKYKVVTYAGMRVKEGEEHTGDTYSFGRLDGGKYMTLLSDGMGSGPEASKESKATVELVERFVEAGFSIETALDTVNSIMSMKFEEDEKFSTLDLSTIDLYTGKASFIKVGAAASFIKRGDKIKKISSNMPPFGLMDKVLVESVEENLKGGDIIITLSDGVLDVDKDGVGDSAWLEKYLKGKGNNPRELVEDILEESKKINNGTIKDDMSIIVSKVHAVY
ncbi:stage II sporulation protein E [Clostridium baratii]|uniref:stage II sporulation protein E n=1 Tax=Clostridium baratii TaxID=1561 RepID=UPI0030D16324